MDEGAEGLARTHNYQDEMIQRLKEEGRRGLQLKVLLAIHKQSSPLLSHDALN